MLARRWQLDAFHLPHRPLVAWVELADRFDLVAEVLEAHGMLPRRRKHVDDAAAHGELAQRLDQRMAPIPRLHQLRDQIVGIVNFETFLGQTKSYPDVSKMMDTP